MDFQKTDNAYQKGETKLMKNVVIDFDDLTVKEIGKVAKEKEWSAFRYYRY